MQNSQSATLSLGSPKEELEPGHDLHSDADMTPDLLTVQDSLHTLLQSLLELGVCAYI